MCLHPCISLQHQYVKYTLILEYITYCPFIATIINNVKTSMFCSVLNLSCFVLSRRRAEVKLPSENTSNEAQKNRGLRNLLPFMV